MAKRHTTAVEATGPLAFDPRLHKLRRADLKLYRLKPRIELQKIRKIENLTPPRHTCAYLTLV